MTETANPIDFTLVHFDLRRRHLSRLDRSRSRAGEWLSLRVAQAGRPARLFRRVAADRRLLRGRFITAAALSAHTAEAEVSGGHPSRHGLTGLLRPSRLDARSRFERRVLLNIVVGGSPAELAGDGIHLEA